MNWRNITRKNIFYLTLAASIIAGFLLLFIEIVDELKEEELIHFDESVIKYVQAFISPRLTEFMSVVTFLGSVKWLAFSVLAAAVLCSCLKRDHLHGSWFFHRVSEHFLTCS